MRASHAASLSRNPLFRTGDTNARNARRTWRIWGVPLRRRAKLRSNNGKRHFGFGQQGIAFTPIRADKTCQLFLNSSAMWMSGSLKTPGTHFGCANSGQKTDVRYRHQGRLWQGDLKRAEPGALNISHEFMRVCLLETRARYVTLSTRLAVTRRECLRENPYRRANPRPRRAANIRLHR